MILTLAVFMVVAAGPSSPPRARLRGGSPAGTAESSTCTGTKFHSRPLPLPAEPAAIFTSDPTAAACAITELQ